MKVLVLYRPNSEYASGVETFVRDLQTQHNLDANHLQIVDYDSPEGNAMADLYDVTTQPSIVIVDDTGSYIKHWQGPDLPLMTEVAGYAFQY